MLFPIQKLFYRCVVVIMRLLSVFMPEKKPTMLLGPGASEHLCVAIAQSGVKKLLIVTDAMLVQIGLHQTMVKTLKDNGVESVIYDGVEPDPTFQHVEEGLAILRQHQCDAVLAIGGGSPIDTAKVISARATNEQPITKMAGFLKIKNPCLPLFAVPTTAGTGSEATIAAVVSDPVTHQKSQVIDAKLVPLMAALDPLLMTGLPPHITAATGIDALTHAVEAYLSVNATQETDSNALAAVRLIFANLTTAHSSGDDLKARQAMAMASFYAGSAFTKASLGYVHAIAHQFGAFYHTPHGLANSIVLPHILDYSKDATSDRMAQLAEASGLVRGTESEAAMAEHFISRVRELQTGLALPQKLDALQSGDIPAIASAALKEAHYNYPVPKYMNRAQCELIIKQMLA
jgi:alcohol dehydrogenase class IV